MISQILRHFMPPKINIRMSNKCNIVVTKLGASGSSSIITSVTHDVILTITSIRGRWIDTRFSFCVRLQIISTQGKLQTI